jgi:hypothetical protein
LVTAWIPSRASAFSILVILLIGLYKEEFEAFRILAVRAGSDSIRPARSLKEKSSLRTVSRILIAIRGGEGRRILPDMSAWIDFRRVSFLLINGHRITASVKKLKHYFAGSED